jgi:hypothetical protein
MSGLVFVSASLFPYTACSAGRAMFNMLRSLSEADQRRTTLVMVDVAIDLRSFEGQFPHVRLVEVDTQSDQGRLTDLRQHPPAWAYSNTPLHWKSACVFRALSALDNSTAIDYVEFPDEGGLAFCTLQECRLQGFLPDAVVAVRIHMSHTALLHAEAKPLTIADLNLSDLERKCLRDCDCIVAPTVAMGESVRQMFGLTDAEWSPRVVCHVPRVLLDFYPAATEAIPASADQSIVFASTLQRFERPDLFVRGVVGFMRTNPHYVGTMVMAGDGIDEAYTAQVERLVPAALVARTNVAPAPGRREFEALLSNATVVFPRTFESACLAAFEASLLGARVILNEKNAAFGDGTVWVDGVNCLKFDGTVYGLMQVLERNSGQNENLEPVLLPESPAPWISAVRGRSAWHAPDASPTVSIVVAHHNLGDYLGETLESLNGQAYKNIEIIIVDDASTDSRSAQVIDVLASKSDLRFKVVRLVANVGLAAARNVGVQHASGTYVLTLDADDLIHPNFLAVGVAALENNPEFDIVVTPAGYFLDGEPAPSVSEPVDFCDYALFSGEAVVAGLIENRFSTATALFRKSALDRFPYEESLNCYEDWSLFMRMCDAGLRFIVTTDVFFYYRRRHNSMVHAPRDIVRRRLEYSDMLRTGAPAAVRQKARHLLVGIGSPVAGNHVDPALDATALEGDAAGPSTETAAENPATGLFGQSGQYDEQVVFASLKLSRWVERKAPSVLRGGISMARWGWRAYRAVRGIGKP